MTATTTTDHGGDSHGHGDGKVLFYARPVQRQHWGEAQIKPHTNCKLESTVDQTLVLTVQYYLRDSMAYSCNKLRLALASSSVGGDTFFDLFYVAG